MRLNISDGCDAVPRDYGSGPLIADLTNLAKANANFRTALWTGSCMQVTLMRIKPGESIGAEMHPGTDQLIRVESGCALVQLGSSPENLPCCKKVSCGAVVLVPAGTWHNVQNPGPAPLCLSSVYAPPQHPYGTVHRTKADAQAAEEHKK